MKLNKNAEQQSDKNSKPPFGEALALLAKAQKAAQKLLNRGGIKYKFKK